LLAEILARHDRKLPRGDEVIVPIWTAMNARGAAAIRKVFEGGDLHALVKTLLEGIA
jgi:hypothetical protein